MKKNGLLICFILFFCDFSNALDQVSADSILTILRQKDSPQQRKQLILSIRYYFSWRPVNTLEPAKRSLDSLLSVYKVPDGRAVTLFAGTMYLMELKKYVAAENELIHAITLAEKDGNHYLLYACFTQLAFLQSLKGNTTEAVQSFRRARWEAIELKDAYLQVLVDINISDIYYRNKLHRQSLVYLDQAQALMAREHLGEPVFAMMIRVNKAENYFNIGNTDSLAIYSRQLFAMKVHSARLYTFQQRSAYSLELLRGQYNQALNHLATLKKDPQYNFDSTDEQNLAGALYKVGELDSAVSVATRVITAPAQMNHPEVTLPLYEMLAHISVIKKEKDPAIYNFSEALKMAKLQMVRLAEVDTIAARLRLDDMQNSYLQREDAFKQERRWLIFSIAMVVLLLVAGAMLYRNIRQKRHFERLLFEARRNELSYINSHYVRRHLSNILGIIDMVRHSDDSHAAYMEAEPLLKQAADDLDISIREIANKLNDNT